MARFACARRSLREPKQDWPGLEDLTRSTEWPPFDFLPPRLSLPSAPDQNRKFPPQQEWSGRPEGSVRAAPVASRARAHRLGGIRDGRGGDSASPLGSCKNEDTKLEALQTLYQHYAKLGDTAGLYRTLLRLVEVSPNDLTLQNNSAQISLLLGADVERARKVAAEVKGKEPSNGAYVSTYAFSLYTKGDVEGALRAMDQLGPEQLRDPSIAVYYGVVLAAAGQKEKAREYLRRAAEANLLPEEKALVSKAQNTLQ